jgi:S-adenosylmethionine/arginine decarboxylase-like enzyme
MQAKIWNYSVWIQETNPQKIKEKFDELLNKSGFDVLDIMEYYFKPYGYTCIWLLGESHCAVHTFPEHQKSYIELSSCNLEFYKNFLELTEKL